MSNREAGTPSTVVWLDVEQVYGELIRLGAFFSTVKYVKGGIEYEVLMENDDFTLLEDLIEYDSE